VHQPVGAAPGTLESAPDAGAPHLSAIGYGGGRIVVEDPVTLERVLELRRQCPSIWIDVTGFADVGLIQKLGEQFGLHRLALEDVLNPRQRAKVEDYGEHQFLVLRMIDESDAGDTEQLGLFVGNGFVLTFQEHPGDCFGLVRKRLCDPAGQMQKRGSDYLAYALLDAVVDGYFPVLEGLDKRLDGIEEGILSSELSRGVVREVHEIRRCLLELRRAVWPLRDVTGSLMRSDAKHFSAEVQVYLRDVHDHVVQLLDLLETCRELSNGLLELHMSTVSFRLNEVMKFLTIIATIFIPLTFVVGVYGMNFKWMPELEEWWAYPACLGVMAAIAATMLWWFRRRQWI
jgi:magnesium transporter